jgi:glycosyltransferase involved in cell wall biosynthesis
VRKIHSDDRGRAAGLGLRDGHDALIRDEWDEFAEAICNILEDRILRAALETEARQTAESRFSWAKIAESAYAGYRAVTGSCGSSICGFHAGRVS